MVREDDQRRRLLVPLTGLILCIGVLVAAPSAWYLTLDENPVPAADGAIADDVDLEGSIDREPDGDPSGSGASNASTGSAAIQEPTTTTPIPAPALFMAPSLGISTQIRSVGVRDDGQVAIPDDGDVVGWYRFGSAPGSAEGSSVIVGHRDTKAEGPGVLYPLATIEIGQEIAIYRDDWSKLTYRVTSKQSVDKSLLALNELFSTSGAARLTVITCGGTYIKGRGYSENVVVTAVPTGR